MAKVSSPPDYEHIIKSFKTYSPVSDDFYKHQINILFGYMVAVCLCFHLRFRGRINIRSIYL